MLLAVCLGLCLGPGLAQVQVRAQEPCEHHKLGQELVQVRPLEPCILAALIGDERGSQVPWHDVRRARHEGCRRGEDQGRQRQQREETGGRHAGPTVSTRGSRLLRPHPPRKHPRMPQLRMRLLQLSWQMTAGSAPADPCALCHQCMRLQTLLQLSP